MDPINPNLTRDILKKAVRAYSLVSEKTYFSASSLL